MVTKGDTTVEKINHTRGTDAIMQKQTLTILRNILRKPTGKH